MTVIRFILIGAEGKSRRGTAVKVPKIYWKYTRKAVLTMEWIDGIKLTDTDRINEVRLDRKRLIDQVCLSCCSFLGRIDLSECFLSLCCLSYNECCSMINLSILEVFL